MLGCFFWALNFCLKTHRFENQLACSNLPSPGPSMQAADPEAARPFVGKDHLLASRHWREVTQGRHLIEMFRSLPAWGTETGSHLFFSFLSWQEPSLPSYLAPASWYHLHAHPLPCSRAPVATQPSGGSSQAQSFSLSSQERNSFCTPHKAPQLLRPASERWALKAPGFQNQQACNHGTQRPVVKGKWLLKSTWTLTHHRTQHRSETVWKVPRFYVKKVHLLILRCWPKRQGPAGILSGDGSSWVPSLSSRCTALQSTNISQRGTFTPVWCPGFCGCHPGGIPLECVALKARGLVLLGLWNYDIRRDGSWQTTTPREPDNRLTHIPQSFQERAYLLVWELWPEGQDSRLALVEEPMEGLSGNSGGWRMQSVPSPADQHLPGPCLVPQFLQLLSGDTPTSLVMVARGLMFAGSEGLWPMEKRVLTPSGHSKK